MTIVSKFAGKRVLMTGTTGFVGKVMLEKFLFSLSAVDKIYVLIRNKEGSNLSERFKKEIVSSPCFNRLRGIYKGKFDEFIHSKVQPMYLTLDVDREICISQPSAWSKKWRKSSSRPAILSSTARPASTSMPDWMNLSRATSRDL